MRTMRKSHDSISAQQSNQHRNDRFITVSELAARWAISESAVYHRKGGTGSLTRIRFGNSLRFLREEVEKIEKELIRKASRCLRPSEDMIA
jgi:predicted DNA-binding transcriptional regulator AlpA